MTERPVTTDGATALGTRDSFAIFLGARVHRRLANPGTPVCPGGGRQKICVSSGR
jgi:hypothetical protein